MAGESKVAGLRGKVFQGGAMLMGRQVISMGLSLIGLLVITRIIGPAAYGPYVAALGICQYALNLGQAGIMVYLVRKGGEVTDRTDNVATTLIIAFSGSLVLVLEACIPLIGRWTTMPAIEPILAVLLVSVFVQAMTLVPMAKLERGLDFRSIAMIETVGQLLYYCVSLPLVLLGFGVWSLVAGWTLQQAYAFVTFHICARYRPHFAWDRAIAASMLKYAFGYAATDWIYQLRSLVNPLIVGHFLPAEAVGQIGLAIRMLELLTLTKSIAYRLSVAVLAKIQDQPAKLLEAATEGMRLQTLALGPILLGFSWFGGYILEEVFGPRWEPVMLVYPYLALSYLMNAQFNIHASILYVLDKLWDVSRFNILHVLLFAAGAWICVSQFGLVGYGYGELAALLAYPLLHYGVRKMVGTPDYGISALWLASVAVGLFWRELGLWAIAVPFLALACPPSIRQLIVFYRMITGTPRHAV